MVEQEPIVLNDKEDIHVQEETPRGCHTIPNPLTSEEEELYLYWYYYLS